MRYVDAHIAIVESTCTELARGPWVTGPFHIVSHYTILDARSQSFKHLGSETISLVSSHMTCKPPQADSPES